MVRLVELLSEVDALHLNSQPPPPQTLVQMQARDVGKIWHPCHCLEEPEARDGPAVEERVQQQAQDEVGTFDHPRGADLLAAVLALPHGVVRQGERRQLLAHAGVRHRSGGGSVRGGGASLSGLLRRHARASLFASDVFHERIELEPEVSGRQLEGAGGRGRTGRAVDTLERAQVVARRARHVAVGPQLSVLHEEERRGR
mmetsp:Transcript_5522/g.21777  ORF Transcript_5522/g.21777 Transcript_5522/m.21777 type:complete len:200 (+) Transcript_5522:779-1378(+)